MTKFILHGGFSVEVAPIQENNDFFREIIKDISKNDVKILLVYFAEREEIIPLRIEQDKESFTKNKREEQHLNFKVATVDAFISDCAWADVIYLHGGRTVKLIEALEKYSNLGEVFLNKTIAGDSAGANALGQVFYSKNSKQIGAGFGILPFKIVTHYNDTNPNPLTEVEPHLETILLHEYEVRVIQQ